VPLTSATLVEPVLLPTDDARLLVDALESELSRLYTREERHGFSIEALFQPHIKFFIARVDGEPVGCGGVAFFDGFAEVKRMYARPDQRGKGIATAVMARLESETAAAGHAILRLETGSHSHGAIRFYRRCGFVLCPIFKPYDAMPPQAVVTSVFMEKRLRPV